MPEEYNIETLRRRKRAVSCLALGVDGIAIRESVAYEHGESAVTVVPGYVGGPGPAASEVTNVLESRV